MRDELPREVNENPQPLDDPPLGASDGGVSPSTSPRERTHGPPPEAVSRTDEFKNTIRAKNKIKKYTNTHSPQIKISVIKLIKVMHANMPLGSRPDFRRHAVVESCTTSTFDVCILDYGK